ncbi:MAG TPA: hypothetical protein VGP82_24580 [Ktedonobacterales bacterium]|nr:hypothetical protein [Ktedonobacterales bacterium]
MPIDFDNLMGQRSNPETSGVAKYRLKLRTFQEASGSASVLALLEQGWWATWRPRLRSIPWDEAQSEA